jgi:hypothetical protein
MIPECWVVVPNTHKIFVENPRTLAYSKCIAVPVSRDKIIFGEKSAKYSKFMRREIDRRQLEELLIT